MITLQFMGQPGQEEAVRCRVYGEAKGEPERRAFVERLAGDGVLDCPAFDPWIEALQERGWLDAKPLLVEHPTEPNAKAGLWRLTEFGRRAWEAAR